MRGTTGATARTEARANARLAPGLALAELQKHTGADTRVTAPANLVDENYPPLLGVWRSWEGINHQSNGRPIAPPYNAKTQTASPSGSGRFVNWLVSSATLNPSPAINQAPTLVRSTEAAGTVPLLAPGSLAPDDPRRIHISSTPTAATPKGGHVAWWVSGENQKARLAQPYEPRINGVAGLAELGQTHPISDRI